MLISTGSGVTSVVVRAQNYHVNTTLQLVGAEADIAAMTDIAIEQPAADFDPSEIDSYTGAWTALKSEGNAVVLNSDNRAYKFTSSIVVRLNKTAAESVGVAWSW